MKSNNLLCYRFLLLHSCFYIQINHPLYYCTSDSICYIAKPLLIQCWIWNRMKSFNFIWKLLIYSASVSFYVCKRFHFELFVFFCFLQLFTLFFFSGTMVEMYFGDATLSDVVLLVDGHKFHVHKMVIFFPLDLFIFRCFPTIRIILESYFTMDWIK